MYDASPLNTLAVTDHGIEIVWYCPVCATKNHDLYNESTHAYCEDCVEDYSWIEVLSIAMLDAANDSLVVYAG